MRKLAILGAAIGALALPTGASAFHVPGATYNGTVSTGQGGTVQIIVASDGQTLSYQASGLGNTSGTCTGVGFGPVTGVPITNHAFNISENGGQVTASGFFGSPGAANGSAQVLTTPCTTGSQNWSATTTEPFAAVDGMIQRSTDPFAENGNDVWNTTGAHQTRSWTAKRGQTREFDVVLQNDGTETGSFSADGCGNSRDFVVTYRYLGNNVTNQVMSGNFARNVFDGDIETIDMRIKPKRSANIGQVKTCAVREESDINVDVVKAKLTVKRG